MNIKKMKKNKIPKLIYLDQNQWVELEKVEYQENQDIEVQAILKMLKKLAYQNKIILPIDFNRLVETAHRKISFTRERLSKLMIELSKGYAVLPFMFVEELEIRNYINRKLGLNEVNLIELLINQNGENLLAGTPEIVGNELRNEIHEINKKIPKLISSDEFKKKIISIYLTRDRDTEKQQVANAENARSHLKNMESDKERKRFLIDGDCQYLVRKIMEIYKLTDDFEGKISEIEKLGNLLMLRNVLPLKIHSTKERVDFMQEFPLFYTHRTLVSFRDRDLNRPIESNDLIDIVSYVVPIVYFHYVVGEKYFIELAKQAKLDILYNTILCRKLTELKPHLELILNE